MNQVIVEISPEQAYERVQSGALLVDVREDGERAAGMAEGAMGVSKSRLEADPGAWLPDRTAEVVLICAVGGRSMQCSRVLNRADTRAFFRLRVARRAGKRPACQ